MYWTFYVQTFVTRLVVRMCVVSECGCPLCRCWQTRPVIHTTVMCCQYLSLRWFRIHKILGKRMLLPIHLVMAEELFSTTFSISIWESFFRGKHRRLLIHLLFRNSRNSYHLTHIYLSKNFQYDNFHPAPHFSIEKSQHLWLSSGRVLSYLEVKVVSVMAQSLPWGHIPWVVPSSINGLMRHSFLFPH